MKVFTPSLALFLLLAPVLRAEEYKRSAGTHQVEALKFDWKDEKRDRVVPVKIYLPKGDEPFPVVIFSHGLGGSREGYEYLGRHWASHGYASVHLQHIGSDESVWRGKANVMEELKKAVAEPKNALNRPADVRFVIDELTRLNKSESPLKGKLDLDRLGMAGHSFGAYTTLAVSGQVFVTAGGRELAAGEPRIKAAIPMSPNAPKDRSTHAKSFGSIKIPTLHLTGTKDDSPIDPNTKPADRRIAFDNAVKSERYLVIFEGGDHSVFAMKPRHAADERRQDLVRMSTTAFWDAHLKEDMKARSWLLDGLAKEMGKAGAFEQKPAGK